MISDHFRPIDLLKNLFFGLFGEKSVEKVFFIISFSSKKTDVLGGLPIFMMDFNDVNVQKLTTDSIFVTRVPQEYRYIF